MTLYKGTIPIAGNSIDDSTLVHKAGDETITGAKTFTAKPVVSMSEPYIEVKNIDVTRGSNVANRKNAGMAAIDANGAALGYARGRYETSNNVNISGMEIVAVDPTGNDNNCRMVLLTDGTNKSAYLSQTPDAGSNDNTIATTAWVKSYGGVCPPGTICAFGGSSAPSGWLICNGGAISRTTYANLFSVIGTTYGSGDGSTTFNLPSLLDGRTPIGGNSTYIGTTHKGKAPNITGRYGDWASNIINTWLTGAFYDDRGIVQDEVAVVKTPGESDVVGSCGFSARRCSTVYTDSIDYIEPKALYTNYIIKY